MKKFGEKLKDFFYDAIDYVLMIVIIVVVAGIIGWRLNVLFDKGDSKSPALGNKIEISKDDKKVDNEENKVEENEQSSVEIIKIVIPVGSPGSSIADILLKEGLIENKEQFLSKMSELKLDTKLKCGEFEISKNSTVEEILEIITK